MKTTPLMKTYIGLQISGYNNFQKVDINILLLSRESNLNKVKTEKGTNLI